VGGGGGGGGVVLSEAYGITKKRKMTKFYVFWSMRTTAANLSYFHMELNAGFLY